MAAPVPWTLQLKDTVVIAKMDSIQQRIVILEIECPDQVLKRKRCGKGKLFKCMLISFRDKQFYYLTFYVSSIVSKIILALILLASIVSLQVYVTSSADVKMEHIVYHC